MLFARMLQVFFLSSLAALWCDVPSSPIGPFSRWCFPLHFSISFLFLFVTGFALRCFSLLNSFLYYPCICRCLFSAAPLAWLCIVCFLLVLVLYYAIPFFACFSFLARYIPFLLLGNEFSLAFPGFLLFFLSFHAPFPSLPFPWLAPVPSLCSDVAFTSLM